MREIVLGSINASLNIKENDELLVYSGNHAFKGKFKKMMTANLGFSLEVDMNVGDEERTVDLIIPCDEISAIGKVRDKNIQTVSDSKINDDVKKSKIKKYNNYERSIEKAGSAKSIVEGGVSQ